MIDLVIDVNGFTTSLDEHHIAAERIPFVRVNRDALPGSFQPGGGREALLRVVRTSLSDYTSLYDRLSRKGLRAINTPEMHNLASEYYRHYALISEATPKSVILPVDGTSRDLMSLIREGGLRFPVFLKTDRKSLKGRSLVTSDDEDVFARTLAAIRKELSPFEYLVAKQVIDFDPEDYRCVVVKSKVLSYDTGVLDPDGLPPERIRRFSEEWVSRLRAHGFAAAYVMDVGTVRGRDQCVIVEIKDLQNTQIKRPTTFWQALAKASRGAP